MTSFNPAQTEAIATTTERGRGRPPKVIFNPFEGFIGPTTGYGRYPYFASDIIEGIARLDWHDRPIEQGGSSKPLSVRRLFDILAQLPEVSAESVGSFLSTGRRQAQRYVKAIQLAMPYLMKARPAHLALEMDLGEILIGHWVKWTDWLTAPAPATLAKLHHDLRDLGPVGAD
ncbi:hypothetical protein [Pseudomonas peli]|uniref:hypothetical protein n=1 Tax=Pseudomonas peli TaxID=592361 RepID=UPI0024AD5CAA|nr:hypothetical protein [Pseudomonas peli]